MVANLRTLVATFWAGSLWTASLYAVLLFATSTSSADRQAAGMLAGLMFKVELYVTVISAGLIAVLLWASRDLTDARKRALMAMVMAGVVCAVTVHYGVRPMMEALKAANPGPLSADVRTQYGLLHGVASLFYFAECVLAGLVVVRIR
jgi:hypothetical protein